MINLHMFQAVCREWRQTNLATKVLQLQLSQVPIHIDAVLFQAPTKLSRSHFFRVVFSPYFSGRNGTGTLVVYVLGRLSLRARAIAAFSRALFAGIFVVAFTKIGTPFLALCSKIVSVVMRIFVRHERMLSYVCLYA